MNTPRNRRQIQMLVNARKEIKEGDLIERVCGRRLLEISRPCQ